MQYQSLILLCFAAALAMTFRPTCGCFLTKKQTIHVVNSFSAKADTATPLLAHCASKDDDFGVKTLRLYQDFHWEFCPIAVFKSTLYFCHFFWGTKQKAFVVYDQKQVGRVVGTEHYWAAEDDGIYYYNNGDTPFIVKKFDWA